MNRDILKDFVIVASMLILAGATIVGSAQNRKRTNEIDSKLDAMASQTDAVNDRLEDIQQNVDEIEQNQEKYQQMFEEYREEIKNKFNNVFDRIHDSNEHIDEVEQAKIVQKQQNYVTASYTASASTDSGYTHPFRSQGTVNDGTYNYTYYSQRVLPGGGLDIPGRHVDDDGFIRDENGNLCIASSNHAKGTEIDTPYGKGVVYDYCPSDNLDIYTDW